MAKGQRSNRKKALRGARRDKVGARVCVHRVKRCSTPPVLYPRPTAQHPSCQPLNIPHHHRHDAQVKATWQEEADKKRLEALRKCMEAAPVALKEDELARIEEAKAAPPRGRAGGAEAMDADGAAAGGGGARGAKGKKRGKKGVAVGGRKGRKKQVGVLSAVSGGWWGVWGSEGAW